MGSIRELLDYILNVFKFWIVVQPWERAVRTRFGKNQRLIKAGVHLRIPFLDSFYIQCVRLRVVNLPMQNITSKDFKTITVNGSAGYEITNIETLYNTMYEPESTISNIIMGTIADYIYSNDIIMITPADIEKEVLKNLDLSRYGLNVTYFKMINFAVVKTFRLIQDQSFIYKSETLTKAQ